MVTRNRVLAGLVLGVAACGGAPEARMAESATAAPTMVTVDTATVALPITIDAQLYVEHDAIVYARSGGIVESIHVDLGSPVREGQLLATLEDVDQQIALAEAQQALTNAEQNVQRARALGGQGVVTVADSQQAEFVYGQAGIALRRAQRAERLTRVVAPFAGAVTARTVRVGRLVASGDSLFRVTALAPLLVSVRVPESAAATIAVGDSAEVATRDGATSTAWVARLSPTIDAASGTRECVLRVGEAPGLRPGAGVSVRLGAVKRTVIAVPAEAISEDGYVLVATEGRTTLRAVTTGARLGDGRLEVLSGLAPGERVVRTAR